jgi:hypothetical protein
MEWCQKREEGMSGMQKEADVLHRLITERPFDCRGNVPEKQYGMLYIGSSKIVQMHDCKKSFGFFQKIINEILSRRYTFASL